MDRCPERLAASALEFDALGIDFTRVTGIDYREMDPQTQQSAVDHAPDAPVKRELSPGEIACFLSHIKVWREIAHGSAEMAWVFEDDISFEIGARATMRQIESGKRDWDIIRLYSHKPIPLEQIKPLDGRYSLALSRRYPMSTIAYAITRSAADHLYRSMSPFSLPVDLALKQWWIHGLCTKVVTPSVCKPRDDAFSASTLDTNRQSSKGRNLANRFLNNLRYQMYMMRMRRIHASEFPEASKFS